MGVCLHAVHMLLFTGSDYTVCIHIRPVHCKSVCARAYGYLHTVYLCGCVYICLHLTDMCTLFCRKVSISCTYMGVYAI